MSISKNLDVNNFLEYMHKIFAKRGKDFSKSFGSVILSMMHCCSASSWSIASSLSSLFDKGFKASLKQVSYLLSNDNFEVDDQLWRCYLKSIFAILDESSYIKKTEKIYIQVDYTTIKNDFLILYGSIVFNGKSLPIYFTKRAYPKKKNQMSMTKMEKAFLKGLRHILSVKYNYVIVADRGFGTNNFTQECINNGFDFIVRLKENLRISHDKYSNLQEATKSTTLEDVEIKAWEKSYNIIVKKQDNTSWSLCTNMNDIKREQVVKKYKERFKIEKCFFEQKSNGFNIEKSKVRKYERMGRLLFCVCVSQAFMLIVGNIVKHNHHDIKKNFPQTTDLILALLPWQKSL